MRPLERQSWRRMRWRMRGAWQWPAFVAFTLADGAVLALLPFYGDGPGGYVPGVLVAGFFNLLAVALGAPIAGRLLRRRRQDLPRMVASNYAGTTLVVGIFLALILGGILHRPATEADARDHTAVMESVHAFVSSRRPELQRRLAETDVMRLEDRLYRACVPQRPGRWLCLFVSMAQSPPGVTRDHDEHSNAQYHSTY